MSRIPLAFPRKGVSEILAVSAQPPGTSFDAKNVCNHQPSGREQGGQREGLSRLPGSPRISTHKIQALAALVTDTQRTDYTDSTTSVAGDLTEQDTATPSKTSCSGAVVDEFGNVYAFDGAAALVKCNAELEEVWRFSIPVRDESHVCRALEIDPEGRIYVAVSEGGNQESASMWAFDPDDAKGLVLLWKLITKKYVSRIRWREGTLVTSQNNDASGRSEVVVYELVDTAIPQVAYDKQRPFPTNDFAINSAGEIATTHPPNTSRGLDPSQPECSQFFDEPRWQAKTHLTHGSKRFWCELDPEKIKSEPGFENIRDGDDVDFVRDTWTNARHLFKAFSTSSGATPFKTGTYVERSLGGKPAIRFGGNNFRMESGPSLGGDTLGELNDFQPLLFPGKHQGWAMAMLVKVSEADTGAPHVGRIIQQNNDNPSTTTEFSVWANTRALPAAAAAAGWACIATNFNPIGAGETQPTNNAAVSGKFDNRNSTMLITLVCDNNEMGVGFQESYLRINGVPLAKWSGKKFWTNLNGFTRVGCKDDGTAGAVFDLCYFAVLQSYTDDDGLKKVITCPDYNANNAAGGAFDPTSDTELERWEAEICWKKGVSHLLDRGDQGGTTIVWDADGGASRYEHPFTSNPGASTSTFAPPNPSGRGADTIDFDQLQPDAMTVKGSPQRGNVRWVYLGEGQGYGIAVDSEDSWYTVGPGTASLIKLADSGATVALAWSKTFLDSGAVPVDFDYSHAWLTTDQFNNLFVPFHWSLADPLYSLLMYDSDGNLQLAYRLLHNTLAIGVLVDPRYVRGQSRPEHVVVFGENGGVETQATVSRVKLLDAAQTSGALREVQLCTISDGTLKLSDGTTPTGGSMFFNPLAQYIFSLEIGDKLYFGDGEKYGKYDGSALTEWKSTSAGSMPKRCRLGCSWRNRAVLARGDGDPHNWHMSAKDNPLDWNQFPATVTATQAISGNNSVPGMNPDILNALIPVDKERLIFGGDHTIHVLYGDPMEGGSIILISDSVGIAFGSPWAKDESGTVYFFGSRGGVYRWASGQPEKISTLSIDKRLQGVDFSNYRIGMEWMAETDTLRIFQLPFGAGGVLVENWRWERKFGAWWPEKFGHNVVQPTATLVLDGDSPTDRKLILGCEDGYLRYVDQNANTDDGYTIDSYVTWWPISTLAGQVRLQNPEIILADDGGHCLVEMFASPGANALGEVQAVEAVSGDRQFIGVRGAYTGLRLRNTTPGVRWSYEDGSVEVWPAGR